MFCTKKYNLDKNLKKKENKSFMKDKSENKAKTSFM